MSFFATVALLFVLIIRPQEIWPFLADLRLLDLFTALSALGVLIDFGRREQRDPYSPQLPFVVAFVFSCYFSTGLVLGREAVALGNGLLALVFMCVVMYGARTFQRLRALLVLLLILAGLVAAVAVHQGQVAPVCVQMVVTSDGEIQPALETADGRSCINASSCREEDRFDIDWACERLGLFDTVSIGRRVRWRGQLNDPNELSVFIAIVMPLVFAVGITARRKFWALIGLVGIGVGLYAVILSQSRGGQLVVATIFLVYFVSRFGWKGLLFGAVFALPVLLLGGRDDEDADSSSEERMQLLYDGIRVAFDHPIFGVGKDQFKEHVSIHLTAHNAYLLAATELGIPGFFAWSGIFWTSVKIPFSVVRSPPPLLSKDVLPIAKALLASFIGLSIGIFFLSFTYKQLLFVWFGISGALYGVVRHEDPSFRVTIGWKDFVAIGLIDAAILGFIFFYSRYKVG